MPSAQPVGTSATGCARRIGRGHRPAHRRGCQFHAARPRASYSMILRARQFSFTFPRPTLLMGVVNLTPDSFSDGGTIPDTASAVHRAVALIEEGADIIDIGGESTRPNAVPVSQDEELRRVLPVIEELARRVTVPISIDTMKPAVAEAALR